MLIKILSKSARLPCRAEALAKADAKAAIAAAGQGARSPLRGSRGEQPPGGARRSGVPARPKKGAQWRRKRFRKTARKERAHTVGGESGFVENSR